MQRGSFPLTSLPAWCILHNITFTGVAVADTEGRGLGLIAERDLSNEDNELPALLTIPHDLILSAESVEEYAKENKDFRELLDAAGRQVNIPIAPLSTVELIRLQLAVAQGRYSPILIGAACLIVTRL